MASLAPPAARRIVMCGHHGIRNPVTKQERIEAPLPWWGGQLCSPRAGPVSCRRVNYTHAHICRRTWRKTAGQGRRAWWDLGLGPGHRVHPSRAPMERRNGRIVTVAGWGCRLSKVRGLSGNGSRSLTLERKGRPLSHLISPGQALKFWQVPASSCYAVHAAPLHK